MSSRLLSTPTRKMDKTAALWGVAILLLVAQAPVAHADDPELDPAEPSYAIDNFFVWDQTELEVLIVPPAHGPLLGQGQEPLPDGPEGALATGTYLQATLQAIDNWRHAIETYAQQHPEFAWLAQIEIRERVLAVDEVTPQDVAKTDILVIHPEHGGIIAGASANTGAFTNAGPGCVAANTLWLTANSMNRYDMFKLAGHEFGHCLGLGHTVGNSPREDVLSQGGYPNDSYRCPSTLDMQGLVQSFAPSAGQGSGGAQARVDISSYAQICHPGLP